VFNWLDRWYRLDEASDPGEALRVRCLVLLVPLHFVFLLGYQIYFSLALQGYDTINFEALALIGMMPPILVWSLMSRTARWPLVAYLFLATVLTFAVHLRIGGIHGYLVPTFLLVPCVAMFTLDRRMGFFFSGLSILAMVGLVIAESQRLPAPQPFPGMAHHLARAAMLIAVCVAGTAATWLGITVLTAHRKALRRARDKAENANQLKSAMIANISHDIRTPLTSIVSALDLMERSPSAIADPKIRSNASRSARVLMRLVDEMLDLWRIDAGSFQIEQQSLDAKALIDDIALPLVRLAQAKGLTLKVITPDGPVLIESDPSRLQQIWQNLISNAIKYTEQGQVTVEMIAEPNPIKQTTSLTLIVTDTGQGMDPVLLSTVFDRFVRGPDQNDEAGMGLGLAIAKEITTLLGGTLDAVSTLGEGASFTFQATFKTARSAQAEQSVSEPHDTGSLDGLRVLIVDDAASTRLILERILTALGCVADAADNGATALEKIASGAFDVALVDRRMPVMDGIEVITKVRALTSGAALTPLIGCSANASLTDRQKMLHAGADGFIAKPVRIEILAEELGRARLLGLARHAKAAEA
jgi:signal transduction histidine kinase/ActR/RegA family two-component response regulator